MKHWNHYHKANYPKITLNATITPTLKRDANLIFTPMEEQLNFV
jgi:hypothetical protein